MRIDIPCQVEDNEHRVAITPAAVHGFTSRGHGVFVQVEAHGLAATELSWALS
jgi:alanine dehydrogenase